MVHTVLIEVSDETLAAMRRDPGEYASELRVAAAAKLYELGRVSQEVAAEIAGLNRVEFLLALSRFQVTPFQDTRASLQDELERG
jgi:predicted HTH domain antitoxin